MAQFLSVFKNICNFVGVILERECGFYLLYFSDELQPQTRFTSKI